MKETSLPMLRLVVLLAVPLLVGMATLGAQHRHLAVRVQGGTFRMGTAAADIPFLRERLGIRFRGSFEDEAPAHLVTVRSFLLDRYEVTNDRFHAFVQANPEWSRHKLASQSHNGHYLDHWKGGEVPEGLGSHPVVFVTWHSAQAFCRSAGGRLPTEGEWEYAARARSDHQFPWGDELPSPVRANYAASGLKSTAVVGSYPPNAIGLFDVAGNVWEWVLDPWPSPYPTQPASDPMGAGAVSDEALSSVGGRRVIRGGSFDGAPTNLRTRWRDSHLVANAVAFVGFRCAYPAEEP
jgi:formylglycine-generating enzyme required for sulfatase activity